VGVAAAVGIGMKEKSATEKPRAWLMIVIGTLFLLFSSPRRVSAFCHELEVARGWGLRTAATMAAEGSVKEAIKVEWFGHATFQLTSSKSTRVLMDPHAREDLRWPSVSPHIVTASHPHFTHSNLAMAKGSPLVLHGLLGVGEDWNRVHTVWRDVSIYTVPAYHDKSRGLERGRNAIFVVRMDDLCVAHLGDLGHPLTPEQLRLLGKIDILLVPLAGGMFTIDSHEARDVLSQVKPRIAVPMHYWWEEALHGFVRDHPRVRRIQSSSFTISKASLPKEPEIVVLNF
jgi:L-ascorbate metabolism protein UlaG (beta-lactamase superfamily)